MTELAVLARSLDADIGGVVSTNNPKLALQRLYAARKAEPQFATLSLHPRGNLIYIRKSSHPIPQNDPANDSSE